jgi:hypothetical protein
MFSTSLEHLKPSLQVRLIKTGNSYLWTYDLYGPVRNAFDAGNSITRASGRGLGPGDLDFLGPVKWLQPLGNCHLG